MLEKAMPACGQHAGLAKKIAECRTSPTKGNLNALVFVLDRKIALSRSFSWLSVSKAL